jgi:hypothetical protein
MTHINKSAFLYLSVIMNVILLGFFFLYQFTPLLDWAVIIKSQPRICKQLEKNPMRDSAGNIGVPNFCK